MCKFDKTSGMKYLLSFLLAALLLSACDSANEERPTQQYENQRKSLEETEQENPLQFLKITGGHHINLLQRSVVEGTIQNNATLAAYKDIKVQISFLDKSGDVIERDVKVLNDVARPHGMVHFKLRMKKPKGTSSALVDIVGATADK